VATVLFVAPHQDDEVLTMGAAISNHVSAGVHDVHVAVLCDGGGSGVRAQMAWERARFVAARDDEFRRSCRALGVPAVNVHFPRLSSRDGELTADRARDALLELLARLPGAWVKTHTNRPVTGRHPDHAAAGQAALDLYDPVAGPISNLRFYVEPYHLADYRAAYGNPGTENAAVPARVRAAVAEYRRVDHPAGVYGIGGLSVPNYLALVDATPASYVHAP
jgi:LmbE family N-acetylglucosaminyl deacetylase